MRVTFLLPCDNLSGGCRVVAIYAQQLQARGHQVLVVTCAPERLSPREMVRAVRAGDWQRLRQHLTPQPGHIALSGVPHKTLSHAGAIKPTDVPQADVVIATWWETALWMHDMPQSKGRKVHLIQGYEIWLDPDSREQVHAALRLPNQKIAISSDLKQTIEGALGPLDIELVPNAVDLQQFTAPLRGKQATPTVGFVYARAAIKGADICTRACELARQQLPNLKVVAFGADQPTPELPLPSQTDYFYRPSQAQLKDIYSRCDVWLFGSRLDSFGLPILEAMACRTPVIAVPVGAAQELLDDGTGVLVARESAPDMAGAIVAICQQGDEAWRALSQRAHHKAHGYSWNDATERLLGCLQQGSLCTAAA